MIHVIQGDCANIIPDLPHHEMVFLDPPDNIGLNYGSNYHAYRDQKHWTEYFRDLKHILQAIRWRLKPHTTWFSFNARWLPQMGTVVQSVWPASHIKPCVQTFTFGQHSQATFGNNYRPLWRMTEEEAPFYADQIRVPSWRTLHDDKRADPRGRVPGDVFDFPRVVGNSRQRRAWHPTQLNEGLVERCILSCTKPGDWVLDPMAGTGTVGRVCNRLGRNCTLIEIDPEYCRKIQEDLEELDSLNGFYAEIGIADEAEEAGAGEAAEASEAGPERSETPAW